MINADPATRRAFLSTCGKHVDSDGLVVIQQQPRGWFDTVRPSERKVGDILLIIRSADREGPQLRVVVEYQVGDRVWTHAFAPSRITDDELAADLASAGLTFGRWLTDDRAWFTACPS